MLPEVLQLIEYKKVNEWCHADVKAILMQPCVIR